MPACTDRQGLPLGANHFVLLIAPAYSVNEVVERPALALGFPHDELRRVQFHYVELQPLATRRELHGQAFVGSDEPEVLRQCQHCLAALKLTAATQVRPRFAPLQRNIHDFPSRVGRMRLHKGFGARCREVALHLDIAKKPSGQAALAGAFDADAGVAQAGDAGAAVAQAGDAGATCAPSVDAVAALALAEDADVAVAPADDADAALALAVDAGAAGAAALDAGALIAGAVALDADALVAGTLAEDGGTTLAGSVHAGAAVGGSSDGVASDALAEDGGTTLARTVHAGAAVALAVDAGASVGARGFDRWRPIHAAGKFSWSLLGHTHWLLLSLHVPFREVSSCEPAGTLLILKSI